MRIAKTLIKLGGWPGWYESSLGAKVILLVLSWGGSNICVFQVSSLKKTRYGQSALSFYFTGIFYIDIEDLTQLLMYYWIKPAWGKIRLQALPGSLSVFPNEFNKFNNTGARMQYSIYHTTLKSNFIYSYFCTKTSRFASLTHNVTRWFA